MFASSLREDGTAKDSRFCAEATGDFVVNLATYEWRDEINTTSATLPRGESEHEAAGLELIPSRARESSQREMLAGSPGMRFPAQHRVAVE